MRYVVRLFQSWKSDIPAGIVVFLVALPLCLGIALASGAPLMAGIISGIIGGIVIGALSGSQLSVSGPAAGLTIIVLNAIENLGSFEAFLCAVVIAGVLQVLMGITRVGIISLYFPSSVVKGMLAAIGLILVTKQIPVLFGVELSAYEVTGVFASFAAVFSKMHSGSLAIGLISLGIMILWDRPLVKNNSFLKFIPGGLAAVIFGLAACLLLQWFLPQLRLEEEQLVNLPEFGGLSALPSVFVFPDFSAINNPQFYTVTLTIAIIASLETLLGIEAVDRLDPLKRKTDKNRELIAQGIGNVFCGLLGGLPVTAVVVRGSANIEAGGRTRLASICHGVMLLMAVALFASFLNYIPLSSLAAILIFVGYKLTRPALYVAQYQRGRQQFVSFISTVVAILLTDLLVGFLIGMAVGIYYILYTHNKLSQFKIEELNENDGEIRTSIYLSEQVSFLNKATLHAALQGVHENTTVIINGSHTRSIDDDILELLYEFQETARSKRIEVILDSVTSPAYLQAMERHRKFHH